MRPGAAAVEGSFVRVDKRAARDMAGLLASAVGTIAEDHAVPFVYPIRFFADRSAAPAIEARLVGTDRLAIHESQLVRSARVLSAGEELTAALELRASDEAASLALALADETGTPVAELTSHVRLAPVSTLLSAREVAGRARLQRGEVQASLVTAALEQDIVTSYAQLSGDPNPMHTDRRLAASAGLPGCLVHGMLLLGLVEPALASFGLSRRLASLRARFLAPVFVGEQVRVNVIEPPSAAAPGSFRVVMKAEGGPAVCLVDAVARG